MSTIDVGLPAVPRANDVYLGVRLLYSDGFEDSFQMGGSFARLFRSGMACVAFGFLIQTVFSAAVLALDPPETLEEVDPVYAAVTGVAWLVGFLLWTIRRAQDGVSGWQVVIDGRAGEARAARSHLSQELAHRLVGTTARRQLAQRGGREMVRIQLGTYSCYVSVFPFGTDLFVGWVMTDEPSFWNVLGRWLSTVFRFRGWFTRELRSYEAKALRDVVHNVTREAVALAGRRLDGVDPAIRHPGGDGVDLTTPQPRVQFR